MSDATVTPQPPMGMITLRGTLTDLAPAVLSETGCAVPSQRMATMTDGHSVLWMSPDELLIVCDYGDAPQIADRLALALNGVHATVAVVSDARQVFEVNGAGAVSILKKLCPVDFGTMAPSEVRRTRMAQIPAALWQVDGGWRVICFRSVARYAEDLLTNAAA